MTKQYIEPAKSIVSKFGVSLAAEITGRHVSRVYRWMYPRDRGGTGGVIPHADALALLEYAKTHGLDLSPVEFFPISGAAE
ncbi:hypothetical protein ACQZ6A_16500 [Agrobacterium vitis]